MAMDCGRAVQAHWSWRTSGEDPSMTADHALLWLEIGTPACCAVLIVLDRVSAPMRGRFIPRRVAVAHRRHLRRRATPVGTRTEPVAHPASPPDRSPAPSRPLAMFVANVQPPRPVRVPWVRGAGLRRPLAGGAAPAPATVRKRAWTSLAMIAPRGLYGASNADRLERGRPPLRYNPLLEAVEAMHVDVDDVGRAQLSWADADVPVDPYSASATR